MEVKTYLDILWRRRWLILTMIIVTMVVIGIGSLVTQPVYASTITLRVAASTAGTLSYTDYVYTDRLINTYITIAVSGPVLNEVMQTLNLQVQPDVRVEVITNTELIRVTAEYYDPVLAQKIANTLAEILILQSQELYTGGVKSPKEVLAEQLNQLEIELNEARDSYEKLVVESPSDTEKIAAANQVIQLKSDAYATLLDQYEETRLREALRANTITVIEPPQIPDRPVRPNVLVNFGLGFILSLVAGVGLVFFFNYFDSTLYSTEAIEDISSLKVLGEIPQTASGKLLLTTGENFSFRDAIRRLRTNLLIKDHEDNLHTIMVTSSKPGEGKSTIVANLAIAMAQADRKVAIIDCNLDSPSVHKILNLPNEEGLTEILIGHSNPNKLLQESGFPDLKVLTSGSKNIDKDYWYSSPEFIKFLESLSNRFDLVLLDSPAILVSADIAMLAELVDNYILVTKSGETKKDILQTSLLQLSDASAKPLGVVVNQSKGDDFPAVTQLSSEQRDKNGPPEKFSILNPKNLTFRLKGLRKQSRNVDPEKSN